MGSLLRKVGANWPVLESDKALTVITSQTPVSTRHDIFGEQIPKHAGRNTILDKLVHDAYRLEMTGESLRKKRNAEYETESIKV